MKFLPVPSFPALFTRANHLSFHLLGSALPGLHADRLLLTDFFGVCLLPVIGTWLFSWLYSVLHFIHASVGGRCPKKLAPLLTSAWRGLGDAVPGVYLVLGLADSVVGIGTQMHLNW